MLTADDLATFDAGLEIDRIIEEGIPDPIGTFYRYGLAKNLLRRKVNLPANGK